MLRNNLYLHCMIILLGILGVAQDQKFTKINAWYIRAFKNC